MNRKINRTNTKEEELIDPLNMDSWLLICQHLDLKDILNLTKVFPAYKNFLGTYALPKRFKKLELDLAFFYSYFEDISFVLESVRNTVQELRFTDLRLIDLDDKEFRLLTRYPFPFVTEFNLPGYVDENRMYDLRRAFPNLQNLTPRHSTLYPIMLFTHLENLSLTCCININVEELEDLLIELNLKSLTLDVFNIECEFPLNYEAKSKLSKIHNLKLNSFELNWLCNIHTSAANNVIVFKNLKTLAITEGCRIPNIHNLFRNIETIVDREVYEINIGDDENGFICELMVPERYEFLNRVNTLKFLEFDIKFETPGAPNRYKALRELYFYNCNAASWENIMLNICSNAEKLDLLSFEGYALPNTLNDKHLRALTVREKPMTLNWYEDIPLAFCCEKYKGLIKFSQKSYIPRNFDYSYMTIKFRS